MDVERCRFVFGRDEPPVDIDEDELADWFERARPSDAPGHRVGSAVRATVARQILLDTPPEVWAAAQRLTALGIDRRTAFDELVRVMTTVIWHTLRSDLGESDGDEPPVADDGGARLRRMLDSLPTPNDDEATEAVVVAVAANQGSTCDAVLDAALVSLGRRVDDEVARQKLDLLVDDLAVDGVVVALSGERLVHVPSIVRGVALTHRLSVFEKEQNGLLNLSGDLWPLMTVPDVRTADGAAIEVINLGETGYRAWQGPAGWLDQFSADEIVAVRVDADGKVSISPAGHVESSGDVLSLVRKVAEEELADDGMPIPIGDVAVAIILAAPQAFATPALPLGELLAHSGLEVRGDRVAADGEAWHASEAEDRHGRLHDAIDDDDQVHVALEVVETFDDEHAPAEKLRAALHALDDPDVFGAVLDEITEHLFDGREDEAEQFSERLVTAAHRPRDKAIAHYVASRIAEHVQDNGAGADAHVRAAMRADSTFGPAVDLAAFYASLRGDAPTAVRLWRMLAEPDVEELGIVAEYAQQSHAELGRNDPCWCGSGKKFKVCHQTKVDEAPLPERVKWLCAKAAGYLRRLGGEAAGELASLVQERAVDLEDAKAVADAVSDPVVYDAALTEGEWFARFLDTMRGVLPADEELLAESWLLVDRTVYEFEDVRPGHSIDVRDIATGERFSVRERTLSRAAPAGSMWCGRAVPDGETTQFVGAIFPVAPGQESDVLALCDSGDGHELCAWVRTTLASPVQHRGGAQGATRGPV